MNRPYGYLRYGVGMSIKGVFLSLLILPVLASCSHMPGNSEFVCNDAANDPKPSVLADTRGDVLVAILNEIASLGRGGKPGFKEESFEALSRCDREFLIWYVRMSADSPDRLTDYDRKRFTRLTNES